MDNENKEEESSEGEAMDGVEMVQKIRIKLVGGDGEGSRTGSSSSTQSFCQADECGLNLNMAKSYHRRHKVCERHSKAPVVLVSSIRQRFCQQCSKFHEVAQFDENKRSCRKTLAGHNERRRKPSTDMSLGDDHHLTHGHLN